MPEQPSSMALALAEAEAASRAGEVPVGAVLADGAVVARAHNRVEEWTDPTAHAELIVLRAGAKALGTPRLDSCDLYVSLEPCAMCAAAPRDDVENATACGDELVADALGIGVEDLDGRIRRRRRIDAANLRALGGCARIALGRHDDAERHFVSPLQFQIEQLAVARRHQGRQQIAFEARDQHLAFRVAEADVVFDELRPVPG